MTLRLPKLHGIIDRRILINFVADPNLVENLLPKPFKPKLYKQKAIVGICLIRLKNIKPKYFPDFLGFSSENGAHRIAVEWQEGNEIKEGVYVPRRDTGSKLNAWIGGKLFPGKHYLAKFDVEEKDGNYQVAFTSSDDTKIAIQAKEVQQIPQTSIFENLTNVSDFFQKGAIGYSPNGNKLDGIKLYTYQWQMQPLEVESVYSSYFENEEIFPKGSIQFDNALLMKKIEHEWHAVK
jgi:hypothetical protein